MYCLVNVLGRVGMESLLLDVPFVCKAWHKASHNPSCSLSIDFPEVKPVDPSVAEVLGFLTAAPTLTRKFRFKYRIKSFSVTAFIKFVINRSQGNVTFLKLPGWCTQEALKFVADACTGLKSLSLAEELLYENSALFPELISFAVVNCMPNIKYLTMRKVKVLRADLVTILRGCKDLAFLDVRDCRVVNDEELSKFASQLEVICDVASLAFEAGDNVYFHILC
ncbi:PREDICTED: uncharacterized protein LOC101294360 [Fragaria vesca subsp. vesca]